MLVGVDGERPVDGRLVVGVLYYRDSDAEGEQRDPGYQRDERYGAHLVHIGAARLLERSREGLSCHRRSVLPSPPLG